MYLFSDKVPGGNLFDSLPTMSQPLKWSRTPINTQPPLSRDGSLLAFNDQLLLFSGITISTGNSLFSIATQRIIENIKLIDLSGGSEEVSWTMKVPRYGHTTCLTEDGEVILFGGSNDPQGIFAKRPGLQLLSDLVKITIDPSNTKSVEWEEINKDCNDIGGRAFHTCHIIGNQMYTFGGFSAKTGRTTNEVWKLDLNTYQWTKVQTLGDSPRERYGHCSVAHNDKIYMYGGQNDPNQFLGDFFVFDTASSIWQEIRVGLPIILCATVKEVSSKLYIFGADSTGFDSNMLIICYDISNDKFEKVRQEGDTLRGFLHSSVLVENKIYLVSAHLPGAVYGLDMSPVNDNPTLPAPVKSPVKGKKEPSKGKDDEYIGQLGQLYLDKNYSDVTFLVEDQIIPAHKCVLAMRCKHFQDLFSSGGNESQASKFEISDVKLDTFKSLLEFIYCNNTELSQDLALDLLKTSENYGFPQLKKVCEAFLSQILSLENYVIVAEACEEFKAATLRKSVVDLVIKNRDKLIQDQEPGDLSQSILWEVIFKLNA